MKLEGAGVVVFGGASGLGEATARRLAAGGGKVVIGDLNEERGQQVAGEIGGTFVSVNVTDEATVQNAVEEAAKTDGGLRIAVNCAGIGPPEKIVGKEGAAPLVEESVKAKVKALTDRFPIYQ